MNITAIQPLFNEGVMAPQVTGSAAPADFAQWLGSEIQDVNGQITRAENGLTKLATGASGDLHHVMLEMEKAKLAFQLTVQIRNKVLEGYQEIMRMQI